MSSLSKKLIKILFITFANFKNFDSFNVMNIVFLPYEGAARFADEFPPTISPLHSPSTPGLGKR